MARKQIICLTRRMKDEDPHRHISHLGIGDENGWSEVLMAEEVIWQLKSESGDRYFLRGRDGWEADVKLGKCPFCSADHVFLCSAPDLTATDKLLTLPVCG
ncbi:MAG TPA: hypothetical protein VEG30_19075 [Terriglobales bacterium]|nr:hypothetical protein [Terriglobales bacterium]